jgi:hypothetical protein
MTILNHCHKRLKPYVLNPLKLKRERERVRKDSVRVEVKRKHLGEARGALYLRGEERASC